MTATTGATSAAEADWRREFVDTAGRVLADTMGLPPSYIHVLAWLIVCEPAHQSSDDLRAALGLSPGAISMATATQVRMGAIEKVAIAGERRR